MAHPVSLVGSPLPDRAYRRARLPALLVAFAKRTRGRRGLIYDRQLMSEGEELRVQRRA